MDSFGQVISKGEVQERRHDIDSVRVIAIALLVVYHITIVFQPWGSLIPGFFQNENSIEWLWFFSGLINVWRIPILFLISGMGVAFSMRKRNLIEFFSERSLRILLPLIFGSAILVPLQMEVWAMRLGGHEFFSSYSPNPAHLWFLGNIFIYIIFCAPLFFYLKKNPESFTAKVLKFISSSVFGLVVLIGFFALEAEVFVDSWKFGKASFESYAFSIHGFSMGLLCFLAGFSFVFSGKGFWKIAKSFKGVMLILALFLYFSRLGNEFVNPPWLMAIESCMWMFSIFGYSYSYLNKKNKIFLYLAPASYPIYITHMLFMNISCLLLLPSNMNSFYKFFLIVFLTFAGCLLSYECIRRISFLRPLFGLKIQRKTNRI